MTPALCPFCSNPRPQLRRLFDQGLHTGYTVICWNCFARTRAMATDHRGDLRAARATALDIWNRRTDVLPTIEGYLPCPCCGDTHIDTLRADVDPQNHNGTNTISVQLARCTGCALELAGILRRMDASTRLEFFRTTPMFRWNFRPPPKPPEPPPARRAPKPKPKKPKLYIVGETPPPESRIPAMDFEFSLGVMKLKPKGLGWEE